jgi:hypothetical protein
MDWLYGILIGLGVAAVAGLVVALIFGSEFVRSFWR